MYTHAEPPNLHVQQGHSEYRIALPRLFHGLLGILHVSQGRAEYRTTLPLLFQRARTQASSPTRHAFHSTLVIPSIALMSRTRSSEVAPGFMRSLYITSKAVPFLQVPLAFR